MPSATHTDVKEAKANTMSVLHREIRGVREERVVGQQDFMRWCMRVPEPKTGRLDFQKWAFQRELYDSGFTYEDEGVVQKGTQVGMSAWIVRWSSPTFTG